MSHDPATHTAKLPGLLNNLRRALAPADIKDYEFAYRVIAEIQLRLNMARAEIERLEREKKIA